MTYGKHTIEYVCYPILSFIETLRTTYMSNIMV
jgi:hypothetical protein